MNASQPVASNETPNHRGRRLALAVNSHGWEDFPSHQLGVEAAEILACWTALWHPDLLRLLSDSGSIPQWHRIDQLPEDPHGLLLMVPTFSIDLLPVGAENRIHDSGGMLCRGACSRMELLDRVFEKLNLTPVVEESAVGDFFALGYCYLQIQLMTRQLRYSSGLDEDQFGQSVHSAVAAAIEPESDACRQAFQDCFDQLLEERSRYYPTTAQLIDYVLLNEKTLGKSLRNMLEQHHAFSLQASGATIETLGGKPDLANRIRNRVSEKRLSVATGEYLELPSVLLSTWTCARQFERGMQPINDLLGKPGHVFGRHRFGLRVGLPGLLEQFGFDAVVHNTLDDGVFPQTAGNLVRWEGHDGTTLDALVSPPLLATEPETWLRLGIRIGELIDVNQYATLVFAHWPGVASDWYTDLIRSCRYGPVLGEFVTLDEYFEEASDPGYTQSYVADDYRDPWLKQMVAASENNPLSRFVDYWRSQVQLMAASGLTAMATATELDIGLPPLENLHDANIRAIEPASDLDPESVPDWPSILNQLMASLVSGDEGNTVIFNPLSFARRQVVEMGNVDPAHPSVVVADEKRAVIELPPMGYVRLSGGREQPSRRSPAKNPPLAEPPFLRNEFFEVEMDEKSGGIRAIRHYGKRTNFMAQQIALRKTTQRQSRSGGNEAIYSRMVCESTRVVESSAIQGQIETAGSLMINEQKVASFRQKTIVTRGIPVVTMEIEIDPRDALSGDPWHNYIACRFAWDDETARIYAWQNESRHQIVRHRFVSPLAIDIDHDQYSTSILTGGLPFHQKVGYRRLDSLLRVAGESRSRFKLGIGVNLPYPGHAAMSWLHPSMMVSGKGSAWTADHAWIFHLNCKNVLALRWVPVHDTESDRPGIQLLVKETEGRRADCTISCCREIKQARCCLLSGQIERHLEPVSGNVQVPLAAHEMIAVELFW